MSWHVLTKQNVSFITGSWKLEAIKNGETWISSWFSNFRDGNYVTTQTMAGWPTTGCTVNSWWSMTPPETAAWFGGEVDRSLSESDDRTKCWTYIDLSFHWDFQYVQFICIYIYMGMSQNEECGPGSLTRGYDSWVWFGVWFGGMVRGPLCTYT